MATSKPSKRLVVDLKNGLSFIWPVQPGADVGAANPPELLELETGGVPITVGLLKTTKRYVRYREV